MHDTIEEYFENLIPICDLSEQSKNIVLKNSDLLELKKGKYLFKRGETDNKSYFLLEGSVELRSPNNTFQVSTGTDTSNYPLAQFQPRQYSAYVIKKSIFLTVDKELLDSLAEKNGLYKLDSPSGMVVTDVDDDDIDWMSRILQSDLFSKLPPSNIQKIFSKIEPIEVKKGELIIKQDDEGDYFYFIEVGRAEILRKPSKTSAPIKLEDLSIGDYFGEEALVSDCPRNASVIMLSDGDLMRLPKSDFISLIREPILRKYQLDEIKELHEQGAEWIDVRFPDEYLEYGDFSKLDIPLNLIRMQIEELGISKKYIVCCEDGNKSAVAAFLLSLKGFDAAYLEGGLTNCRNQADNGFDMSFLIEKNIDSSESKVIDFIPRHASRNKQKNLSEQKKSLESKLAEEKSRKKLEIKKQLVKELNAEKQVAEKQLQQEIEKKKKEIEKQLADEAARQKKEIEKQLADEAARQKKEIEKQLADEAQKEKKALEKQLADEHKKLKAAAEKRLAQEAAKQKKEIEKQLAEEAAKQKKALEKQLLEERARKKAEVEKQLAEEVAKQKKQIEKQLAEEAQKQKKQIEKQLVIELAKQKLAAEKRLADEKTRQKKIIEKQLAEERIRQKAAVEKQLAEERISQKAAVEKQLAEERSRQKAAVEKQMAKEVERQKAAIEKQLAREAEKKKELVEKQLTEEADKRKRAIELQLSEQETRQKEVIDNILITEKTSKKPISEKGKDINNTDSINKLLNHYRLEQEKAIEDIRDNAEQRINKELSKIKSVYSEKEKEVQNLKKLKEKVAGTLEKNKKVNHKIDPDRIIVADKHKVLSKRHSILNDPRFRDHINRLNIQKEKEFRKEINAYKKQLDMEISDSHKVGDVTGKESVISAYENTSELKSDKTIETDIENWIKDQDQHERSPRHLEMIKEKKELMKKLKKEYMEDTKIKKIRDKTLITEVHSALNKDSDK